MKNKNKNTVLEFYRFSLVNNAKEQQVLSFYNEEEDLLDTLNDFCNYIFENVRKYTDNQGKFRTFTLASLPKFDKENRTIHGFLDSAYTGEYGKIKDRMTNGVKFDLDKNDLFSKEFFYLIYIPKGSKFGFLVVQKKENHGVKTIFKNAFNSFMLYKGVSTYKLELRQAPQRYFLKNFFLNGKLKEYKLISNSELGREENVFKLNTNEIVKSEIKQILINLFNSKLSINDKICFDYKGEFDEVSFVLEFNGSTKTFYIKNKEKIRSNINVTNLIEFESGEPTMDSLIKVSLEIIRIAA